MVSLERARCVKYRNDDSGAMAGPSVTLESDHTPNEESSLLPDAIRSDGGSQEPISSDESRDTPIESLSTSRLIILCLGMLGLQLAWAAELSNGSPFLLSLGMSKSLLAIVWIAGPLAGVVVQPIVGIWSDSCQVSWGRRRPFLIAGAFLTAISLLCLSWTTTIVQGLAKIFGGDPRSDTTTAGAQAFAVFWIYILDIAVNVLQAALRAFIVDIAPPHQQDEANAWASRLMGLANITGYVMGSANLPKLFPWLGNTQLRVLCAVGSASAILSVGLSCAFTPEKNPQIYWPSETSSLRKIGAFMKTSFTAFSRLPTQTQKVCLAQFFNWIGWFPFLFYISTYIGQLYVNPIFIQHPHATKEEIDNAWEAGTRRGALGLLVFALTSFTGNTVLPLVIQPLEQTGQSTSKAENVLSYVRIPGLTIRRAWMMSHIFFTICMWSTLFIRTPIAAVVMAGCVGLSWSMTNWAPFTLIAADIGKRDQEKRRQGVEADQGRTRRNSVSGERITTGDKDVDQAGVVLGLHNVAVSAPQILATLIAGVIFHFSQKERGVANDDSVAQVLRFGGVAALIAWWATSRIA